ncbi:MAG: pirin family protein [Stenotrophomonas sp.]
MKKISGLYSAPRPHWVGDGFPVRSLFSYNTHGRQLSPFLLLDHAGPAQFEPTERPRGVGQHPHRGFETVTIVYDGEVAHRDSTGAGGVIGPGDVQWMTAASGIIHEEFHSQDFTRRGGKLEMAQLWVNLPAADKMSAPGYQNITADMIPNVALADDAGTLRVIAGDYAGNKGPARTFTRMNVWDLRLNRDGQVSLDFDAGDTVAMVILRGTVMANGGQVVREGQMALFDREAGQVQLEANGEAIVLVLSGEPIDEPIAGYGPFVMNTQEELRQAVDDFNAGRFGKVAPSVA